MVQLPFHEQSGKYEKKSINLIPSKFFRPSALPELTTSNIIFFNCIDTRIFFPLLSISRGKLKFSTEINVTFQFYQDLNIILRNGNNRIAAILPFQNVNRIAFIVTDIRYCYIR